MPMLALTLRYCSRSDATRSDTKWSTRSSGGGTARILVRRRITSITSPTPFLVRELFDCMPNGVWSRAHFAEVGLALGPLPQDLPKVVGDAGEDIPNPETALLEE